MYEKDANGYTIMHLAAIHGCNAESTQLLLDSGISVDDMDLLGNTALHLAVVHDSSELAAVLVKNGANIYFKNAQSVRPVDQVAAENLSSVNMMKVLKGKSSNNYGKIGILALLVLTTKQIL